MADNWNCDDFVLFSIDVKALYPSLEFDTLLQRSIIVLTLVLNGPKVIRIC